MIRTVPLNIRRSDLVSERIRCDTEAKRPRIEAYAAEFLGMCPGRLYPCIRSGKVVDGFRAVFADKR